MTFKKLYSALSIGSVLALSTASASAYDSNTDSVTDIRFNYAPANGTNPESYHMYLNTNEGGYWAWTTTQGSCKGNSVDAVKAWLAIAQAALLSGHHIHIVYTYTSGTSGNKCINEMWLLNS